MAAASTTSHGHLERVETHVVGRGVIVSFHYHTGDAQGMNMIVKATDRACRWLVAEGLAPRYQIFSGMSSEKSARPKRPCSNAPLTNRRK